jgi:uncharacterized protein (DUF2236 family)
VASARFDGMYGPDTVTWRVNREAVLLLGGGRALLLQTAHPSVAAAVVQHSSFESDPLGRLYRTIDVTSKIVFGDARCSADAAEALQRVHSRVTGEAADGTPYEANDPTLLLWVWATLVDSSLLVYRRYVGDLDEHEVERYYGEQTRFAAAVGIPENRWPDDYASFRAYFERSVAELRPAEDSHRIADSILRPANALRPLGPLARLITVGLLPPELRARLGREWGSGRERALNASTTAIRALLPLLPGLVREFPAARRARRLAVPSRSSSRTLAV